MNSKETAKLAIAALEDKKAEDIKVIDISEVSVIAQIAARSRRSPTMSRKNSVKPAFL